jgi:sulfur carrier protein
MMDIELNGKPCSLPQDHTVQALIDGLALAHASLAVAINREIVPRQLWAQRSLQAHDRVDIVRAIGGG